jgi:hypothetical protein
MTAITPASFTAASKGRRGNSRSSCSLMCTGPTLRPPSGVPCPAKCFVVAATWRRSMKGGWSPWSPVMAATPMRALR